MGVLRLTAGTHSTSWCDDCLKSSVLEFDIFTLASDGVHRAGHYRRCQDCGGTDAPR